MLISHPANSPLRPSPPPHHIPSLSPHPPSGPLSLALLPLERTIQRIIQNIAQSHQALKLAALVDDDEAVHAGFPDRVEDGVEPVVERAGVDTGEVL